VEISQNLLRILELGDLLRQTVTLVKETFDFYHVHIYLFDENREKLVMAEGYGQAGEEMKRIGHSIPLNAPKSFVARSARYGSPVRVDDVRMDEGWLPNPLLPETQSEVAVPIILEEKVVGVLDVQSKQIARFDKQDIAILSTVANQIALALQNIQRFEETSKALAEAERLQQQYLQTGWRTFLAAHNSVTYQHTSPNAGTIDEGLIAQIKQNIRKGQKVIVSGPGPERESDGKVQSALAMPLALRNSIIGNIRIHDTEKGRQWSSEEIALLEAVSEQMSLALENARLFDETKQRATREQLARQITDKMRSAPNVDSIVETGLTELAKALGVSRTYVKFASRIDEGDEPSPPVSEIEAIRSKLKTNGREESASSPLPDKRTDNSDQVEEM
jgi:GAF domain-containing protein